MWFWPAPEASGLRPSPRAGQAEVSVLKTG